MPFWLCAIVLSADVGIGSDSLSLALLEAHLSATSRVELPASAANLVQGASVSNRSQLTREIIRAVGKISPAAVPAVVGAVSKTTPEMAVVAAGEAAREQPEQACFIAKAAAAGAPGQTKGIVLAVCQAAPNDFRRIALGVEQAIPGSRNQLLEALGSFLTDLPNGTPTNSAPARIKPSLATISPPLPERTTPGPELVRRQGRTSSYDPSVRGPTVGPPFVPLSGAVTNLTPSTSRTVSPGGRNYARP